MHLLSTGVLALGFCAVVRKGCGIVPWKEGQRFEGKRAGDPQSGAATLTGTWRGQTACEAAVDPGIQC